MSQPSTTLKGNFTQVSNEIIHDKRLSAGARLTIIHMLSKPSTWKFYIEVIAEELGFNKDTIASYINELIFHKVVTRIRNRENGRFAGFTYIINCEQTEYKKNNDSIDKKTTNTISESSVSGELGDNNIDPSNTKKDIQKIVNKERKENVIKLPDKLDDSFTPKNVPKIFTEAVTPFYRDAKSIYKLWGKVRLSVKGLLLDHPLENYVDIVVDAFKQSIFAFKNNMIKNGKNESALRGYFFGTLYKMFNNVSEQEYINTLQELTNNQKDNNLLSTIYDQYNQKE